MNMSDLETRLNQASEETRQAARQAVPQPIPAARPARPGWLILAAAFTAVLVVFALVPLLMGPEPDQVGGSLPVPTTVGSAPTTTGPADPVACSSTGVPQPELDPDLPAAVSAKAHAIIRFASMCSIDGLAGVAAPGFVTSFGGGGIDNLARWEEEGYGEMDTLIRLFGTSHAVTELEDGPDIYVWPAAFAYDRWEDIPPEYLTELMELGVYTEGELDEIAKFGSYAGWRVGIDEYGNWLFFVAGD